MFNMLILALSNLGAFLLGAWVYHKAMQHKSPTEFIQPAEDIADIVSPYAESVKNSVVKVKL